MSKSRGLLKLILIDILGVLCIIGALLFGWLPGPGGIPLLFAGLGLLASNHQWAKKLLKYIQANGSKILRKFFPDNKTARNIYDIIAIFLVLGGIVVITVASHRWQQSLGVTMLCISLGIILINRERWNKLMRIFKR